MENTKVLVINQAVMEDGDGLQMFDVRIPDHVAKHQCENEDEDIVCSCSWWFKNLSKGRII